MLVLPLLSTASHVTNDRPMVKLLPDNGLQVTVGLSPELSVALGCCQTATAVGSPGWVSSVWLKGHISNFGASVSNMFTHKIGLLVISVLSVINDRNVHAFIYANKYERFSREREILIKTKDSNR